MKILKMLGNVAVAAMSFMAFTATSASATTLEINGATKNEAVTITLSIAASLNINFSRTDGSLANQCSAWHMHLNITSPFTETKVTGPLTGHTAKQKEEGQKPEDGMSFSGCVRAITVHDPGTLYVEHIAGTTDGDVFSEEAQWTTGSPFGTLNCTTGAGTTIGRLTGKASGNATLDVNAVLNCGFLVPSARLVGTMEVTSPSGLGISA